MYAAKLLLSSFVFCQLSALVHSAGGWCDRTGQDPWFSSRSFDVIDEVNKYRRQKGLSPYPCDEVLVETAYEHTKNQIAADTVTTANTECGLHSWKGSMKPFKTCCYPRDGNNCMWKKPSELYAWYDTNGVENSSAASTAKKAVAQWKSSVGHRAPMMGNDGYEFVKKIGCFRNDIYVNCWFSAGL